MALYSLYTKNPSAVPDVKERAAKAMCDNDPGVMSASLHIFHELIKVITHTLFVKRFSIQYRKTKTTRKRKQQNGPIRIRNKSQARENVCERGTIGFGFASHWLRKWRELWYPITERSKAKSKANAKLLSTLN